MLDHFNQFSYSGDVSKVRRSIIQVIWFASIWEISKERNNRIFTDKECSVIQVVDKIKSLAFRQLKGNFLLFPSITMVGGLVLSPCWHKLIVISFLFCFLYMICIKYFVHFVVFSLAHLVLGKTLFCW